MSDKQTSSCIELSEIRKLDQLLTQCETSSCEHICRDCCAKLGSLEDITDHQDEEEEVAEVVELVELELDETAADDELLVLDDSDGGALEEDDDGNRADDDSRVVEEQCDKVGPVPIRDQRQRRKHRLGAADKMLVRLASDGGVGVVGGKDLDLLEEVEKLCLKFEDDRDDVLEEDEEGERERKYGVLPRGRLLRPLETTAIDSAIQCMEPLTCDRRLNHLTVNKATIWICENCERRNRRSDQQRRHGGGHKKHSLTINEKPTKLLRLQHKCSSENCLKHQQRGVGAGGGGGGAMAPHQYHASSSLRQRPLAELRKSSPSCESISGAGGVGKGKPKLSPQMMARRISCRIPDDLEAGAREALLGSRFGSLHDKKLPEPVETVCEFDYKYQ